MGREPKPTLETQLARLMIGAERSSLLMSDAYKFSMAQVAHPQVLESFYLSLRRPGWYFVPFDLGALVSALLPTPATAEEGAYLDAHGYGLTAEMRLALGGELDILAPPPGSWVGAGEPLLSVSGPSFLASWLEALVIWLHFPVQLATEALVSGRRVFRCSCEDEAAIARLTLQAIGLESCSRVLVQRTRFETSLRARARALRAVAEEEGERGEGLDRIFEVGMRGVSCMQMHRIALKICKEQGLRASSNLLLARELDLQPIGTCGHEHQLRFGGDLPAFRALRDRRSAAPSYLFDSFDSHRLGIPAAIRALQESPARAASVRFDSGSAEAQLLQFEAAGVEPGYVFMDGMAPPRIREIERFCAGLDIPPARRLYGVGSYLGGSASPGGLSRNRVSAVYKLSQCGLRPVMKFSEGGKASLPGTLKILRRHSGMGPASLVAQVWEQLANYRELEPSLLPPSAEARGARASPATRSLIEHLKSTQLSSPTSRRSTSTRRKASA